MTAQQTKPSLLHWSCLHLWEPDRLPASTEPLLLFIWEVWGWGVSSVHLECQGEPVCRRRLNAVHEIPSHCSVAWRWWVTYRTDLKPLRNPDDLTGPEAIPHCWLWACRGGWAPRTRSTSSGHLSSRSLPRAVHAGRLMGSHITKDSEYRQSKSLSGVQGSSHTQPVRSAHQIYSWDKYPWGIRRVLIGVSFSAVSVTVPVLWAALGTYRTIPADHICPQMMRKEIT